MAHQKKIFARLKWYDVTLVLFLLIVIGLTTHFMLIDRLGFWRLIYPIQGQLASRSIKCSSDSPDWMQESVKYLIKSQNTLSNQLAYIDRNGKIYTCQSGWMKTTLFSDAVTDDSRFRYASMTKILTNDAVITLINQRKLNLNDRIVDIFDELKNQKFKDDRIKKITIADLLQQRSGFDRMRSEDVIFATDKKSWCPTQLTQLLNIKLDFEPNARYAYDNRNACLLGAVLERVTKQNYRDYMIKRYDLTKKGVRFINQGFYPDEVRYDFRNDNFWMESDLQKFDYSVISSSAGLSGSAKSLAEIMYSMLDQQPLNILYIAKNNLNSCQIDQFASCNGFAMWQYQKDNNSSKMYFRNGGLPAATSLAIVTDQKEIIVWTSNGASPYYLKNFDEHHIEKYFYYLFDK